jgi:hypothetical protein
MEYEPNMEQTYRESEREPYEIQLVGINVAHF